MKENLPLSRLYLTTVITDASVNFVQSLLSAEDYRISIFNDEDFEFSNVEPNHGNVFIVDIRCPNIQRIINEVN